MAKKDQTTYCSLDIETSGFDPLANEILEVGMAFFEFGAKGVKITEEWTKVFKPAGSVPPQIFGLTGISQKELDEAESFASWREELQAKVKDAIIVGHNIAFDIKFLEAFGIKFSGQSIDTLDLVQWILPTHHSYNLENLMHTFGISHKEAHRALADSKATLLLLEKLLQVYCGFPEKLKKEITKLIKGRNFAWENLLDAGLPPLAFGNPNSRPAANKKTPGSGTKISLEPKKIYNFPLSADYLRELAEAAKVSSGKTLLVLPKARQVIEICREGLADSGAFLPEDLFNKEKFLAWSKMGQLTNEEARFLCKIFVWLHTNWQTQTILDLNLSFFGGQFRSRITGTEATEYKTVKLVASGLDAFFNFAENGLYKNRRVIICGLNEFETAVVSNIGTKTSWGYINYLLKSFYNPESSSGQLKFSQAVEQGLAAGDLFFGLTGALLQTDPPTFQYIKISPETEYDEKYQKIKSAAENFTAKLLEINRLLESKEVGKFSSNLTQFFSAEDNRVKWIELAENRCAFLSMPVQISGLVSEMLSGFKHLSFADVLGPDQLPKFFAGRLGLEGYEIVEAGTLAKKSKQGDLFSGLQQVFSGKPKAVRCRYLPETADVAALEKLVAKDSVFPAAILFSSPVLVKEFYEKNYSALKERTALLAQFSSGGSNKILRNFSINPKSLLLATDKFILKSISSQNNAVGPVEKLGVKTLVICRLPFEQFTHPYQEAVSNSLPNSFMDYALPRALFNFHSLIRFFYTPKLEDIYVIDAKLLKDYARIFKDYPRFIPNAKAE